MTLGLLGPWFGSVMSFTILGVFPMLYVLYSSLVSRIVPPIPFLVLALSRLLPPFMRIVIGYRLTVCFLWWRTSGGDSRFVAKIVDVGLRVAPLMVSS